jgi:hypothetical protein
MTDAATGYQIIYYIVGITAIAIAPYHKWRTSQSTESTPGPSFWSRIFLLIDRFLFITLIVGLVIIADHFVMLTVITPPPFSLPPRSINSTPPPAPAQVKPEAPTGSAPEKLPNSAATHPELTKEIPIFVESTFSANDSKIAAGYLRDKLDSNGFTTTLDQSDAKIIMDVEDVSTPACPVSNPTQTTQYDNLNCNITVYVVGYFVHGKSLFDQKFSGNALESAESLGQDGNSDLIKSAVSNIYQHILSITKN